MSAQAKPPADTGRQSKFVVPFYFRLKLVHPAARWPVCRHPPFFGAPLSFVELPLVNPLMVNSTKQAGDRRRIPTTTTTAAAATTVPGGALNSYSNSLCVCFIYPLSFGRVYKRIGRDNQTLPATPKSNISFCEALSRWPCGPLCY